MIRPLLSALESIPKPQEVPRAGRFEPGPRLPPPIESRNQQCQPLQPKALFKKTVNQPGTEPRKRADSTPNKETFRVRDSDRHQRAPGVDPRATQAQLPQRRQAKDAGQTPEQQETADGLRTTKIGKQILANAAQARIRATHFG